MVRRCLAVLVVLGAEACGLTVGEGQLLSDPEGGAPAPDATAGRLPDATSVGSADAAVDGPSDGARPSADSGDAANAPDGAHRPDAPADAPVDAPAEHALEALEFNGTSAYVDVGALAIPSDFTLEAWIRPTAIGSEQLVAGKDKSGQSASQFRFGLLPDGRVFFMMSDANANDHGLYASTYQLTSPRPVALAAWTHVAVVKNAATFALVVAGAQVASVAANASFTHGGTQPFRIAARVASDGTSATSFFSGPIDEARLWSVARSAADLAADASHPIGPSHPSYGSLAAYYRFDEGAGSATADQIGAHGGALAGNPTWVTSTAF